MNWAEVNQSGALFVAIKVNALKGYGAHPTEIKTSEIAKY